MKQVPMKEGDRDSPKAMARCWTGAAARQELVSCLPPQVPSRYE